MSNNVFPNKIFKHLASVVFDAQKRLFSLSDLSDKQLYDSIVTPPDPAMGDFAIPCFLLSKPLKMAPNKVAEQLAFAISADGIIRAVKPSGPYLNFTLENMAYGEIVSAIIDHSYFKTPLIEKAENIMIEYSQPNTHKELHVGHMRNLCYGNALVHMNRYLGHKVIASTYPGDVGTHVAKCLWYLKFHNKLPAPTNNKGPWLGEMYSKASIKLEDEMGTPREELNRKELTIILKELTAEKGEYFELWKESREWSIELMKQVYKWSDVLFDHWYFESQVDHPSIEFAKKWQQQGLYIESEGAIGADLKDDKLGFCIMIKSDGTGTYAAKDISLAYKKFDEYRLDRSYYVVDKRQALHFKQIFKVLEKQNFSHAKNCFHLEYDFVELPSGAMSSRKGNIIPLTDLTSLMEQKIRDDFLNKYQGEWPDQEISETAQQIANAAIKYGMVRMDSSRKIVFDMNEWLKLDGETGPYLQYVYARIRSLCEKQNFDEQKMANKKIAWNRLAEQVEKNIMVQLSTFNDIVKAATANHRPSMICNYLYDLGKSFNNFYANCPIGKAPDEDLKTARLALSLAVANIMREGLALIGVKVPARM